ncbi:C-terminal processing protease CtpA/Prc, contains a PDZ domain [Clostridium cavendishii DSM 21758]|uniref:C-terminal processing protease CtpA/Prc, contains a PDZ domain n=1 Tax=Clostridium cavendishii DSM 21758 TaxID=1121302 RepID=A0A1M6H080_9CLOT|nr:S41 family peptidase [Clostridium cavendishii]SHJ15608.1 C-terminal processing protease CtpA/Prc, contains a PDZ domain [Clostridium cavendishii DSM 21758]
MEVNSISRLKLYNKQKILIFMMTIIFLLVSIPKVNVFAEDKEFDNGSNIKIEKLDNRETKNLYKLCKVWGFVKYYHPKIASGEVNWDYELFRELPKVLNAKNDKELNNNIYEWINKLGEVKISQNTNLSEENVLLKADIDWIKNNKDLGDQLSNLLVKISRADRSYNWHNYVWFSQIGIATFGHEQLYENMSYSDDGYKLLSLFRCWNIVEYFYPYKNLVDKDWDKVLKKFIPKFIECKDQLSYKLTVLELGKCIHDSHTYVEDMDGAINNYFGRYYAPLKFDFVQGKLVVTSIIKGYEDKMQIKPGDIISMVDNKDVFKLIKEKEKYISFSNEKTKYFKLNRFLLRSNNEEMQIEIKRGDRTFIDKVKCIDDVQKIYEIQEKSHKFINNNIGYICPGALEEDEIHDIMKKFKDTKGLIVDLRYYPSDFIVYSLGEYLLPKESTFCKYTKTGYKSPGTFKSVDFKVGKDNPDYYKGKVTILLNGNSISQSEFTAMALRCAPNSVIIGSDSIGADGDVTSIFLPGGMSLSISGGGVYYPDGGQTQRIGIKPDIKVKPTIRGIKEGRDELVEQAIKVINN